jgi:regulator of protease activity HflC (stomatin/prohibitin superfamily)
MGKVIGATLGALGVLIAITVLFGSWYTIDQGQRGVLLTNGAITATEGPGLHFKVPWFQSVVKVSTQQHVLFWSCVQGTSCRNADERLEMLAYSRDQVEPSPSWR